MPQNDDNGAVEQQGGRTSPDGGVSPEQPSGEPTKDSTDAEQTAQIKNLNRKVVWTWVVATFGPLLALAGLVFSALQWKVADGQLRVMEAQLKDARDGAEQARKDTDSVIAAAKSQAGSMKTLADANKAMVDAAKISAGNSGRIARGSEDAVKAARESVRLDQRAWVTVDSATGIPVVDKTLDIDIQIRNSGRTPARNVHGHISFDDFMGGRGPEFTYVNRKPFNGGLMPPNIVHHAYLFGRDKNSLERINMKQAFIDEVNNRSRVLFVYGYLEYEDTFDECHWTEFCLYYNPDTKTYDGCGYHSDAGDRKCSDERTR